MRIALLLVILIGCDDGTVGGGDAGTDAGSSTSDDAGPPPCDRNVEICGDFTDQNCDGRDTSCGDTDLDQVSACLPGELPPVCDCNDAEPSAYPPRAGLAGGREAECDGLDNDCDGRFDEGALCCAACMALDDPERGDECATDGACVCTTETGTAPCATGEKCCEEGCTDVETDVANCGFCGSTCTDSADRCVGGQCRCGDVAACDGDQICTAGVCG